MLGLGLGVNRGFVPAGDSFSGLLDDYTGAAAVYSVRRLSSTYTGSAMRVREDSGDTEIDIGFDANGDLDTAAIATHCGSANGYVVTWYDQSGNANNATQSTNANQPQIYNGTAVITENGKPAVKTTGSFLAVGSAVSGIVDSFTVAKETGSDTFSYLVKGTLDRSIRTLYEAYKLVSTNEGDWANGATAYYNGTIPSSNPSSLIQALVYINGVNDDFLQISSFFTGGGTQRDWEGNIQEIILYSSDQSSNRTAIETDINSNFLIYQPTDTPTSGLLADYSGAAAAYSVRQLANTAVLAMRIRRDGDDEETNIGFDENGDLDTTAISDFCGSDNGYVVTWFDQSTEGNHATQSTGTNQPQIYNGTAVFTNGSPARPEIRATTNARMVLGTLAHDVDRKYFGAVTASVSSFCVLFGSNSTADYELLAQSGNTGAIFDGGGAIVNRNGSQWYNAPTLNKNRDDVWTDFSSQSIVMVDHALATVTGRTTQLGYANNGIPMFHMQELIIYPTGTSHAVSDIEDAINSYFQVYT